MMYQKRERNFLFTYFVMKYVIVRVVKVFIVVIVVLTVNFQCLDILTDCMSHIISAGYISYSSLPSHIYIERETYLCSYLFMYHSVTSCLYTLICIYQFMKWISSLSINDTKYDICIYDRILVV